MDDHLVSIITPSYNSSGYISETISSIMSQSYKNWELLITDDFSTDDTVRIVEEFKEKDSRIKLFRLKENSGAGVARNNSIKNASGRFIAFCDSDDVWLPNKLEQQVAFMIDKSCAFSYSSYLTRKEDAKLHGKICSPRKVGYFDLLKDNCIGCLTAIYDADFLGKVYMPNLRKRQDWGLWLMLIKKCKIAYGIQEPLAIYRIRNNSVSFNKLDLIKHNIKVYRVVLSFSILKSYMLFIFLFLPAYTFKKIRQKVIR